MTLKKAIWAAALCTGFIGTLFVSAQVTQVEDSAAAAEIQGITPVERGPHVLPPI